MRQPNAATQSSASNGPPAVIVGGGVAALAASIAVESLGIPTVVLERRRSSSLTEGALFLMPNGVLAAKRLGLEAALSAAGTRMRVLDFRSGSGRSLWKMKLDMLGGAIGTPCVAVPRQALLSLFQAQIRAIEAQKQRSILRSAHLVDLDLAPGHVDVQTASGETVRARFVIGADGFHSRVRNWLHGDHALRSTQTLAWMGLTGPGAGALHSGESILVRLPRISFWAGGLKDGRVGWYAYFRYGRAGDNRPVEFGEVREALRTAPAPVGRILSATPPCDTMWTEVADRLPLESVGRGRVTLLGDAFQPIVPTLSQGTSKAIEAAVDLRAKLQQYPDQVAEALRAYEQHRLRRETRIAHLGYAATVASMPKLSFLDKLSDLCLEAMAPIVAPGTLDWLVSYRAGEA